METKIVIDIVCVHCGRKIQIQKRKSQEQCKFLCPVCKKNLHILFNTSHEPQTYSFLSVEQSNSGENKSAFKEGSSLNEEEKKANKDKTIYKKDKRKAQSFNDIPGEDDENLRKKNKPKLRETLFLTRKKYFGLVSERYKLSEGQTVIGREDDDEPSDISITGDDTISRRSVSINIVADDYGFDYILKVLNASNPVRVNGKQIKVGEKVYLDVGDIITIGNTNLKFDNQ